MTYEEKYQELVELSHSDNPKIREQADVWLTSIGLQDAAELKVSAYLGSSRNPGAFVKTEGIEC